MYIWCNCKLIAASTCLHILQLDKNCPEALLFPPIFSLLVQFQVKCKLPNYNIFNLSKPNKLYSCLVKYMYLNCLFLSILHFY